MRIVRGKWAGRDLTSPNDFRVHPTAERVRAAVLDLLAPDLRNASVLDLFAGTGALGLEALSRGAQRADFVETRPASLHALKANVAALRVRDCTRVFKRDALPFAQALRSRQEITFTCPHADGSGSSTPREMRQETRSPWRSPRPTRGDRLDTGADPSDR